jgi:hypothetical protein
MSMVAAFLVVASFNHQFIENFSRVFLAYSQTSNNSNNYKNGQSITYYSLFSDLSRNFTGTVEKFKHNNYNNSTQELGAPAP